MPRRSPTRSSTPATAPIAGPGSDVAARWRRWSALADRLLKVSDVAELLQLRIDHVYKLAREGWIPHLKFGRVLRFRSEAIERWLEEQSEVMAQATKAGGSVRVCHARLLAR
jgi:excisionase family DNA binding protein